MPTKTWSVEGAICLAVVAVLACGDSVSGDPIDIRGDWVLYDAMAATGIVCHDTLLIFFVQKKHDLQGTFSLRGACVSGSADTALEVGSGVLGNGYATTEGISFQASKCLYQGWLFQQPADSAAGDVGCDAQIDGAPVQLTGTWYAQRR